MRTLAHFAIATVLFCGVAHAQSLGEIARQNRAAKEKAQAEKHQQSQNAEPAVVINDDNKNSLDIIPPVNAERRAKIDRILKTPGWRQRMQSMFSDVVQVTAKYLPLPPKGRDDYAKEFLARIDYDELMRRMEAVYDRNFTEDDLAFLADRKGTPPEGLQDRAKRVSQQAQETGREYGERVGMQVAEIVVARAKHGDYGPINAAAQ